MNTCIKKAFFKYDKLNRPLRVEITGSDDNTIEIYKYEDNLYPSKNYKKITYKMHDINQATCTEEVFTPVKTTCKYYSLFINVDDNNIDKFDELTESFSILSIEDTEDEHGNIKKLYASQIEKYDNRGNIIYKEYIKNDYISIEISEYDNNDNLVYYKCIENNATQSESVTRYNKRNEIISENIICRDGEKVNEIYKHIYTYDSYKRILTETIFINGEKRSLRAYKYNDCLTPSKDYISILKRYKDEYIVETIVNNNTKIISSYMPYYNDKIFSENCSKHNIDGIDYYMDNKLEERYNENGNLIYSNYFINGTQKIYEYNNNGMETLYLNIVNGEEIERVEKEYNEKNLPIQYTAILPSIIFAETMLDAIIDNDNKIFKKETYEYEYDKKGNVIKYTQTCSTDDYIK